MKKYLLVIYWHANYNPFGLIDCQVLDEEELNWVKYAFDNGLKVEVWGDGLEQKKVNINLGLLEKKFQDLVYLYEDEAKVDAFISVFGESFGNCDLIDSIIEAAVEHQEGNGDIDEIDEFR